MSAISRVLNKVKTGVAKGVTKIMAPTVKAGKLKDAQMSAWSSKAKSGELN